MITSQVIIPNSNYSFALASRPVVLQYFTVNNGFRTNSLENIKWFKALPLHLESDPTFYTLPWPIWYCWHKVGLWFLYWFVRGFCPNAERALNHLIFSNEFALNPLTVKWRAWATGILESPTTFSFSRTFHSKQRIWIISNAMGVVNFLKRHFHSAQTSVAAFQRSKDHVCSSNVNIRESSFSQPQSTCTCGYWLGNINQLHYH